MGSRGPAPKRSEQRRRRNKPDQEAEQSGSGAPAPELNLDEVHPLAAAIYEALKNSPESTYFTEAVWQRARVSAYVLSKQLYSGRVSSQMYQAIQADWKDMLISPAEQRRLGIEVRAAKDDSEESAAVVRLRALDDDLTG